MNIRQLHSFIALAETLHFGQAAQRMNMTQPPLSRQIAALEVSVGTELFSRHSRSVVLTPAGENFYRNIKQLLGDLDFAVKSARATAQGTRGELQLGFTMYAAWSVLPQLVAGFSKRYPDVTLQLNETLPRDLQQALQTGELDIGISFPLRTANQLSYQILHREPLCAVLPEQHRLAQQTQISVAELASERFVSFPQTTAPALHEAVLACCHQYNFEPDIQLETHLQQTIVNLVAHGIGVALVPNSMRKMQLSGARFISLQESSFIEQGLYWNPRSANRSLGHFISCAKDVAVHR